MGLEPIWGVGARVPRWERLRITRLKPRSWTRLGSLGCGRSKLFLTLSVFWLYSSVVPGRPFAVIAHLRAEIENGDARTDSALVAKSEVGKVVADLRGPAEPKRKTLPNAGVEVSTRLFDP